MKFRNLTLAILMISAFAGINQAMAADDKEEDPCVSYCSAFTCGHDSAVLRQTAAKMCPRVCKNGNSVNICLNAQRMKNEAAKQGGRQPKAITGLLPPVAVCAMKCGACARPEVSISEEDMNICTVDCPFNVGGNAGVMKTLQPAIDVCKKRMKK